MTALAFLFFVVNSPVAAKRDKEYIENSQSLSKHAKF